MARKRKGKHSVNGGGLPVLNPNAAGNVVDNKWQDRKEVDHATMFIIIKGLFANLCFSVYYFQKLILWKSQKTTCHNLRSHDVYDPKWVRLGRHESWLLCFQ
jgi:hypothetical protein